MFISLKILFARSILKKSSDWHCLFISLPAMLVLYWHCSGTAGDMTQMLLQKQHGSKVTWSCSRRNFAAWFVAVQMVPISSKARANKWWARGNWFLAWSQAVDDPTMQSTVLLAGRSTFLWAVDLCRCPSPRVASLRKETRIHLAF